MNNLKAKLKKQGGFTLIEMLIVVAIIAILIAVSIPLVNGALERARDATDQANERAAKAVALLYYMGSVSDSELLEFGGGTTAYVPGADLTGYYDAVNGNLVSAKPAKGYGQCTGQTDCYESKLTGRTVSPHVNKVIKVDISATAGGTGAGAYKAGEVRLSWD